MPIVNDNLGAGSTPAACARTARSVDRSNPPWATRSASILPRATVEPLVRRIVAERLGVDRDALAPAVSLTDELAADSLDLLDVAVALESECGVSLPDRAVASLRTYQELVDVVATAIAAAGRRASGWPVFARTRVVAADPPCTRIERAGALTPYAVEVLIEDVRHAGAGARVEMELPADTGDEALAAALGRLGPLSSRGIDVRIRRERRSQPAA
jgi:acyl carrier protein